MDQNNTLMLLGRSPETWAALFGGMLFAYLKSDARPALGRGLEAAISGLVGFSMGIDAARYSDITPAMATFFLTAVGYAVLDGSRALVADRAALKEMILKVLGGSSNANK